MPNRFYTITSVFLLFLLGYLTFKVLSPFLNAIGWAIVFSIVFYPVYVYILKLLKFKTVASIITLIIIVVIVLGPFTYVSFILISEIRDLIESMNKGGFDPVQKIFTNSDLAEIVGKFQSYLGFQEIDIVDTVTKNIKKIGKEIAHSLTTGITNIAGVFLNFIFMLFAVFFFLKDGPGFLSKIRDYLPFAEDDKNRLISKVRDMVISTVYGGVIVALIQGTIGGLTFYLLGIKSPVLLGSAICIMSFLPFLGTFSVWGPIVVYLFIQNEIIKGFILLIVGALGISMVDNILKPIIISGRTKMPTLVVFFSVLGGIKLFGFIGFIMGPLVLALFVSIFEIFRHIEGGEHA